MEKRIKSTNDKLNYIQGELDTIWEHINLLLKSANALSQEKINRTIHKNDIDLIFSFFNASKKAHSAREKNFLDIKLLTFWIKGLSKIYAQFAKLEISFNEQQSQIQNLISKKYLEIYTQKPINSETFFLNSIADLKEVISTKNRHNTYTGAKEIAVLRTAAVLNVNSLTIFRKLKEFENHKKAFDKNPLYLSVLKNLIDDTKINIEKSHRNKILYAKEIKK